MVNYRIFSVLSILISFSSYSGARIFKRHSHSTSLKMQLSNSNNNIKTLLFDLDGTLYSANNGYIEHIRSNIFEFIYRQGFVTRDESAEAFWRPIFKKYNQTYRGLRASGYNFDEKEYWSFHRQGMEKFLNRDDSLRKNLEKMKCKEMYIFTNCHEDQAIEALKHLGIDDLFSRVFGAGFMGDYCKPEIEVFEKIFHELKIDDPSSVCLFEDSYKNLVSARSLGIATVFVESITATEEGVNDDDKNILNAVISSLSDDESISILQEKIPSLFHDY